MFRKTTATFGLALMSSALLLTSPVQAYDPCDRATQEMIAARTQFENYCNNSPRKCANSSPRYQVLFQNYIRAYERMRQECRGV